MESDLYDFSRCSNHNCPIKGDCKRFATSGVGYTTLFKPVRRRDGEVWCSEFKKKVRRK